MHLYVVRHPVFVRRKGSFLFSTVSIPDGTPIPSDTKLVYMSRLEKAGCESEPIGQGLFLTQDVHPGEVVAKFPGSPRWFEVNNDGDIDIPDTEYVFVLGLFDVIDSTGMGTCERYLAWDSLPYTFRGEVGDDDIYRSPTKAHFINTYHPRSLQECYRKYNCVWGVKYDHLVLDVRTQPNAELYAISIKQLNANQQLLLDYHWYLAYEKGNWCLNRDCWPSGVSSRP